MRVAWALVIASLLGTSAGCTCQRERSTPPGTVAPAAADAPDGALALAHDLELHRTALTSYGNTVPLPVSEEFREEVPQVEPALARAAAERANEPIRIRVARDVPYGQLTRLMQSALAHRVMLWEVQFDDRFGVVRAVTVRPPSPTPKGDCWSRAWIGPDARIVAGIDVGSDASTGMTGVVVPPKGDLPRGDRLVDVVHRTDYHCKQGQLRLYSQPTARAGVVFDVAYAFATAPSPPVVRELVSSVPSIGALDSADELVP